MPVLRAAIGEGPLDAAALSALVDGPSAGVVVTFVGQIRDHDPEASGVVTGVSYTHHPDAAAILARLAEGLLAERDPRGEASLVVEHRVGRLAVGDLALVAAVATPHRAEAFALCSELVERVKAEVPIWKQQFTADGRHVWSGLADRSAPGDAHDG